MVGFVLFVLLSILGFALYGFIVAMRRLLGNESARRTTPQDDLSAEVAATCRMLDRLYHLQAIDSAEYHRLRNQMEAHFPAVVFPFRLAPRLPTYSDAVPTPPTPLDHPDTALDAILLDDEFSEPADARTPPPSPHDAVAAPATSIPTPTAPPPTTPPSIAPPPATPTPFVETLHPLDRPDDPPAPPARPWSDLLQGFMQEKNIRWGELASGILIVGSAVGLVVSLREQLRETIPYFPALLFMLITAAIHAAGAYTLRRWKLRNTSRGVLIIGLLLVPLNFLAACILTGTGDYQRPITDPIYWVAIVTGLASFSTMTWFSSKYLLRRGNLPMVVAVMGSSVSTLVINRIDNPTGQSWLTMALSLPVALSFLIGVATVDRRQWARTRWSDRVIYRLLLMLGIAAFSSAAALSLLVVRADEPARTLLALSPTVAILGGMTAWLGAVMQSGTRTDPLRITNTSLFILGLVASAGLLVVTIVNPTVHLLTCAVIALLMAGLSWHRLPYLWPVTWGAVAAGTLSALHLATGSFLVDQWVNVPQLRDSLLSGVSGLCLLITGGAIASGHVIGRRLGKPGDRTDDLRRWLGLVSGGGVAGLGCLLALVASIIHRDNAFDVHTASALLGVAAFACATLCIATANQRFAVLSGAVLLVGLLHWLLWNPFLVEPIRHVTLGVDARWQSVAMLFGLLTALNGALVRWRHPPASKSPSSDSPDPDSARSDVPAAVWTAESVIRDLATSSAVTLVIATLGILPWIPQHTGLASIFAVSVTGASLLLAWAHRHRVSAAGFSLATAVLTIVVVAELGLGREWITEVFSADHLLLQSCALAGWAVVWTLLANYARGLRQTQWLLAERPPVEAAAVYSLTLVLAAVLVVGMLPLTQQELSAQYTPDPSALAVWLPDVVRILSAAIACVFASTVVTLLSRPHLLPAAMLVVLWLCLWSALAIPFAPTNSVASALRWLLPLSGSALAVMIASRHWFARPWKTLRATCGFVDPPIWNRRDTQRLVNLSLTLVVLAVLVLSTLNAAVFMLQGARAFGGPLAESIFSPQKMLAEVSFGVPVAMVVATFLFYAARERRSWLATCGSAVFQYMVVMAIVLLFLSPNPALATKRFLNIVQAVSIGMSLYGLGWFYFRARIGAGRLMGDLRGSQLDVHTGMNALLVASLAVLLLQRFFLYPDLPAGWINEAAGVLGFVALVAVCGQSVLVWRAELYRYRTCFVCGFGVALATLVAGALDKSSLRQPWWAVRTILLGTTAVVTGSFVWVGWNHWRARFRTTSSFASFGTSAAKPVDTSGRATKSLVPWDPFRSKQKLRYFGGPWQTYLPWMLSGGLATAFGVRAAALDVWAFELHFTCLLLVVSVTVGYGLLYRSAWASAIAVLLVLIDAPTLAQNHPAGWFHRSSDPTHVMMAGFAILAIVWIAGFLFERNQLKRLDRSDSGESRALAAAVLGRRSFMAMPNLVGLVVALWILLAALLSSFAASRRGVLLTPSGIAAILLTIGLLTLQLWNVRAQMQIAARYLLGMGLALACATRVTETDSARVVACTFACACSTMIWGYVWAKRDIFKQIVRPWNLPRMAAGRLAIWKHVPRYDVLVMLVLMLLVVAAMFGVERRSLRYLAAATPLVLGLGMAPLSAPRPRGWLQLLSIVLITVSWVFVAWADLTPRSETQLSILARTLLALGTAVFAYGWVLPRKIGPQSPWLPSVRITAWGTALCALICFAALMVSEWMHFHPEVGCGLPLPAATAIAVVIVAMITGLLAIAVLPQHDPLSLSLENRRAYVYAAQVVGAMLIGHLYLTMPFLFQLGIKQYWPYVAMLLSFGGVGLARVLKKRDLEVLSEPIFHSAAVLPVVASCAFWAVDSQADAAMVMLLAGAIYLTISLMEGSLASGVGTVVFGNLALWLFYAEFPTLDFFHHPQLWLIPPAVSVLIAGRIHRKRLTPTQRATLRYLCVAVIYISSTSEIMLSGLGEKLWPPMILALLSVAGIFAGIMLHVRAYLYLGSLFLLMSVVSMVSHAHQRLDHVWPWWAFGIGLGTAILVTFGLFEKRGNDLRALSGQLREWEY